MSEIVSQTANRIDIREKSDRMGRYGCILLFLVPLGVGGVAVIVNGLRPEHGGAWAGVAMIAFAVGLTFALAGELRLSSHIISPHGIIRRRRNLIRSEDERFSREGIARLLFKPNAADSFTLLSQGTVSRARMWSLWTGGRRQGETLSREAAAMLNVNVYPVAFSTIGLGAIKDHIPALVKAGFTRNKPSLVKEAKELLADAAPGGMILFDVERKLMLQTRADGAAEIPFADVRDVALVIDENGTPFEVSTDDSDTNMYRYRYHLELVGDTFEPISILQFICSENRPTPTSTALTDAEYVSAYYREILGLLRQNSSAYHSRLRPELPQDGTWIDPSARWH